MWIWLMDSDLLPHVPASSLQPVKDLTLNDESDLQPSISLHACVQACILKAPICTFSLAGRSFKQVLCMCACRYVCTISFYMYLYLQVETRCQLFSLLFLKWKDGGHDFMHAPFVLQSLWIVLFLKLFHETEFKNAAILGILQEDWILSSV